MPWAGHRPGSEGTAPTGTPRRATARASTGNWDLLFDAVTPRPRHGGPAPAAPTPAAIDEVPDHAQTLEQLQAALAQQRAHARRIEGQLQDTRAALAAAHAQLAGAQPGEQRAPNRARRSSTTPPTSGRRGRDAADEALRAFDPRTPARAVLYLDLDDFKPIDDRHGRDIGEELLRAVAGRLARAVRAQDVVCRLGDEFACVLCDRMGHEQLSRLASQLFDAVSAPLKVGALQLSVRPSIGIAVGLDDGDTAGALLQRADAAMRHARHGQLGYAFFDGQADA